MYFLLAAINLPFVIYDPTYWWNWISFGICFTIGLISLAE